MTTEVAKETLEAISVPDFLDTRIGPLVFASGAPTADSDEVIRAHLDFVHGGNAHLNARPRLQPFFDKSCRVSEIEPVG